MKLLLVLLGLIGLANAWKFKFLGFTCRVYFIGIKCSRSFRRRTIRWEGECEDEPCNIEGNAWGVSHIRMFDGESISYQGQCDLVLMSCESRPSGNSVDIHIRTKTEKAYTFIQGMAIKFEGHHFEMDNHDNFYVDGKFYERNPPTEFAGYPINKVESTDWCKDMCDDLSINVISFDDAWVEFANWGGFLHISTGGNFGNCDGLLGKVEASGTFGRSGIFLENTDEYVQEWRVLNSDPVLFQSPSYGDCSSLEKVSYPVDDSKRQMALNECQYLSGPLHEMCVYDVEKSGKPLMGHAPIYGRAKSTFQTN